MRFVADTPEEYLALTFLQKYMTQVYKGEKESGSELETSTKAFINASIDKSYERPGDSLRNESITDFDTDERDLMLSYIVMAAKNRKQLALEYVDTKGAVTKRIVEPFNWRNGQLVAWCNERNAWRQFKLPQIRRVAITQDDFTRHEPVDIKAEDATSPELLNQMK